MTVKTDKSAMYFTSLKIKNVKCFGEEQELNLLNEDGTIARWTLILGDNGVGKTTLLKCLAWMAPVLYPPNEDLLRVARLLYKDGYDENKIKKFTHITEDEYKSDDEMPLKIKPIMDDLSFDVAVYDKILRAGDNIKTSLTATFATRSFLEKQPSEEVTISIDFERESGKLVLVKPNPATIDVFNSPNLFAYSASRHFTRENFDNKDLLEPTYNLLSDVGELYDPEQVLSSLHHASINEQLENQKIRNKNLRKEPLTQLFNTVKQLIADLLPDIKNEKAILLNTPFNADGKKNERIIEIQTSHGLVSLFNMSLGYQTMLSWGVDLAIRMLWKNPNSANPLEEPAIVIVDEIDLHLHPVWQRTVKQFLTKHFKRTQFICTAHSPFMAQSLEDNNLCVVYKHGKKVLIDSNPEVVKGWSIGQVATSSLFGVESERSPEISKLTEKRRKLLRKEQLSDSEKLELEALDRTVNDLPIGDTKIESDAMRILKNLADEMNFQKKEKQ